jgi:hypothetical protein
VAAFSFAFAPRPRARRRAITTRHLVSAIDCSNSSPVCAINSSTSAFASPERRRIVRVTARNVRPIDLVRSRTRRFCSSTSFASFFASRASARTPPTVPSSGSDANRQRKEKAMDRWQWLLQVILTCAALVRLLVTGRRNGWI